MQNKKLIHLSILAGICFILQSNAHAQQQLETGGQKMPHEWIDKDTHHKVIRLTRKEGANGSFYFHNNPFVGNRMVFYSTDKNGKQIYTVDLTSLQIQQITNQPSPVNGEIVGAKKKEVFYQVRDSV